MSVFQPFFNAAGSSLVDGESHARAWVLMGERGDSGGPQRLLGEREPTEPRRFGERDPRRGRHRWQRTFFFGLVIRVVIQPSSSGPARRTEFWSLTLLDGGRLRLDRTWGKVDCGNRGNPPHWVQNARPSVSVSTHTHHLRRRRNCIGPAPPHFGVGDGPRTEMRIWEARGVIYRREKHSFFSARTY
jgi:hypothetical protein